MLWVLLVFLLLAAIGMPIAFALGISGCVFFLVHTEMPFITAIQLPITQTQNFALLAVPLFIFAGNLMNACGITERLIRLSLVLTGHMTGGLAQVSVAMATLMGGVSGSSTADAAMQVRVLGPDMLKNGYEKGYIASVIGFTSIITSTMPPGIGMILYGTTGQVSIGRLFAAGFTCALIQMAVFMLAVYLTSRHFGYKPVRSGRAPLAEIGRASLRAIWAIAFPVLLLFGIRAGIFTPSEVGAFACIYGLFVGLVCHRELTWQKLRVALQHTIGDLGGIMFLIAMTGIFGYGIAYEQVPQAITGFATSITTSPWLVAYIIVGCLLVAGMFIDGSPCVLLFTPIFLPLAKSVGLDPVVFGLILCTTTTAGILTPPVGVVMFLMCSVLECSVVDYLKRAWPFFAALFVILSIFIFFPKLILFVPNLLF
ncbi:MAG: TRAP transporter large permease [Desulfovibrio sp.]|jgi:tripartite ATP-independent transporter DctM subunit|nr:TRAP transporter large permease [Desulfovibrio sp.]